MSEALWIYRHLSAYMWRARKKYALINKKKESRVLDVRRRNEIMAQPNKNKFFNFMLFFNSRARGLSSTEKNCFHFIFYSQSH